MANSRLIVEAPIFDAFCEKFVARAKGYKVGDPRDPATVIGPLIRTSNAPSSMSMFATRWQKARAC